MRKVASGRANNALPAQTRSFALLGWLLVALGLSLLAGCAHAGGSTGSPSSVVYMQRAIQQTQDGRVARRELRKTFLSRQADLDRVQDALRARKSELEASVSTLPEAERARQITAYRQELSALQATYIRYQRQINEQEERLTYRIASGLELAIDRMEKSGRYGKILRLFAGESAPVHATDVTDAVVRDYDEQPRSQPGGMSAIRAPVLRPINSAVDAILASMHWLELPAAAYTEELTKQRGLVANSTQARRSPLRLVSIADALMSLAAVEQDFERRDHLLQEAAATYQQTLDSFARFSGLDRVLFGLGYALELHGDHERTRAVFYRLFKEHAASPLVPVAYFMLAEHYLTRGDLSRALPFYAKVAEFDAGSNDLYLFAAYRRALCLHAAQGAMVARSALAQLLGEASRLLPHDEFSALKTAARNEAEKISVSARGPEWTSDFVRAIADELSVPGGST